VYLRIYIEERTSISQSAESPSISGIVRSAKYLVKLSQVTNHDFSVRFENREGEKEMEPFPEVIREEHFPQLDRVLEPEFSLVASQEPTISEEEVERIRLFCQVSIERD
jgi:hypothetical protein